MNDPCSPANPSPTPGWIAWFTCRALAVVTPVLLQPGCATMLLWKATKSDSGDPDGNLAGRIVGLPFTGLLDLATAPLQLLIGVPLFLADPLFLG